MKKVLTVSRFNCWKYLIWAICSFAFTPAIAQTKPRVLILTGNGNLPVQKAEYPPWRHEFQNQEVIDILKDIVHIDTTHDLRLLNTENLANYDLLISNSIFLTPTEQQLSALYNFVNNGKAYLTLHCGILSLLNWEKYESFMGGIFIGGPSSEPAAFKVYTENNEFWGYGFPFRKPKEHPVSVVVDDFIIKDELYYFQPNTPDIDVIARAENHPVMWWHPVGRGKVMSLTLGHDAAAKSNNGYKELLTNGVRWLTGIPMIHANTQRPFSNREKNYPGFLRISSFTAGDNNQATQYKVTDNKRTDMLSVSIAASGSMDLTLTGTTGRAQVEVSAANNRGSSSKKINLQVVDDGQGNIASYYGNSVKVSSNENTSAIFAAENLIDGDTSTRWSSAAQDSATVLLDLKKSYLVTRLLLHWEASFAPQYEVLLSENGTVWKLATTIKNGDGGIDSIQFTATPARFVKIIATKKAPGKWGYSLYEVGVYAN